MNKNIEIINSIIKDEIYKIVSDDFDFKNRDVKFVVVDENNYNDNIMIVCNYDRSGVYMHLWDKEEGDVEEYLAVKEDLYGDSLCIVEVENGVVFDRR
jgi:hypothetical protein